MLTDRFRIVSLAMLLGMVFALHAEASAVNVERAQAMPLYAAGRILVKFKPGAPRNITNMAHATLGVCSADEVTDDGWQLVTLPQGMTPTEAADYYMSLSSIAEVEPDYIIEADQLPSDPQFASQWGLTKIGAPPAWDNTTGADDVVVAVIDTGVNYNHEDLKANLWKNPEEIAGNGVDDDQNGFIDDIYGIDPCNRDGDPIDDHGHGTHVAGIIGAVGNNGIGCAGVNWTTKILSIKFMSSGGSGFTSDAIIGIQYIITMKNAGVNIRAINNSWGGGGVYSQALKDAIDTAGAVGILSFCAAGNGGQDGIGDNNDVTPNYPANYTSESIVSVAASDSADNAARFTNYGATSVDIAAPGVGILSTYKGTTSAYATMSGTSMATPFAAGAAALVCSRAPWIDAPTLKSVILTSVDKLSQWSTKTVSGGRLNVASALALVSNGPSKPDLLIKGATQTSFSGDGTYEVLEGQSLSSVAYSGIPAVYHVKLQNDGGDADTFSMAGTGSSSGWTVKYFDALTGGNDITSQVTAPEGMDVAIGSYGNKLYRVEITASADTTVGESYPVTIHTYARSDESLTDNVRMTPTFSSTLTSVALSMSRPSPLVTGRSVTLTAAATGGSSVVYKFACGTTLLRDFSSSNTFAWTPTSAGSYTVYAYAKDTKSGLQVSKGVSIVIKPALSSAKLTASPVSSASVGTPVVLTATSIGGSSVQYEFRAIGALRTTIVQNYSTSKTCTWTPTETGAYTLQVRAREVGNTTDYDVYGNLSYGVSDLKSVSLSMTPTTSLLTGKPISFTATSVGGSNILYKYVCGSTLLRDYNSSNTFSWTPTRAGSFTVTVWAKDPQSGLQVSKGISCTIKQALVSARVIASPTSRVGVNVPVTLTAASIGGINVQYEFRVISTLGATVLKSYSSLKTCTWTPNTSGTFTIQVRAREVGNTSDYDVYGNLAYEVCPAITAASVSVSPEGPKPTGSPITLTASATGGYKPLYMFRVAPQGTTSWTTLRSYATAPTFIWRPSTANKYQIQVLVKETGSLKAYDVASVAVNYTVVPALSAVSVSASATTVLTGAPVTLTAKPTGGLKVLYQFQYKLGTATAVTVQNYSTSTTCAWTPTKAGIYSLIVNAKEEGATLIRTTRVTVTVK